MADNLTSEARSRVMRAIKPTGNALETLLNTELRKRGWRYRRNLRSLPGSPDFAFTKHQVLVFVDGDFWHGWRFSTWSHRLNSHWYNKISENIRRDRRNFRRLRAKGWKVIRIWEHQIRNDLLTVVERIELALALAVL